jgi:hypothetical protein
MLIQPKRGRARHKENMVRRLAMIGHIVRAGVLALAATAGAVGSAAATSAYDGSWSLAIMTERGDCDPTYYFQVDIRNGIVSHPNLRKLHGRVTAKGSVHVSVSVPGKFASGSGRLTRTAGRGRWRGNAGESRCSGSWTAQKY